MTVTLVDTRPSAGTGSAVYDQVDDHNHVSNNRQQTPDLVPLKHQSVAGNEDSSSSTTANRLNPEAHASAGVPDNGDVSAVVDKAKRAAQSLWVLIHAQNCRMGGDRCPHKGCVEAKRVLLHLKTCPSGNNSCSCPSDYNGCHQSRKLLSHYQKCREVRAKQAGMGRRTMTVHHVCLVCSLVARHAKSVLEGSSRKPNSKKQAIASFTLAEPGPPVIGRRTSGATMPPPPPRQPCIVSAIPSWRNPSNSDSSSDEGFHGEITPSANQLMLFSEVVAATTPPSHSPAYSAALGKSLDSGKNQFLTFAASALQNLKRAPPIEELPGGLGSPRRSRAESYDERALKQFQNPTRGTQHQPNLRVDPTWELDLKGEQMIDVVSEEKTSSGFVNRRGRSASLGMLASACLSRDGCDTIVEEEYAREGSAMDEELTFTMDEDGL